MAKFSYLVAVINEILCFLGLDMNDSARGIGLVCMIKSSIQNTNIEGLG